MSRFRTRPLRTVHGPVEVAGLAGTTARALREVGVEAVAVTDAHPFTYGDGSDIVLPPRRLGRVARAGPPLARCDVAHFYFGASYVGGSRPAADARVLRALGKRVVPEFLGSDVRIESVEAARNPYFVAGGSGDDPAVLSRIRRWSRVAQGHAVVCDHGLDAYLRPHFDHLHVVGQRVDVRRYEPAPPPRRRTRPPVVVHAPSSYLLKGTRHVRDAVARLRESGVHVEYVEVHGMSQAEALSVYARADLVVDQLRLGAHGVFAVEAMAMAKPVVCYIQPDLVGTYPADLPLINANPDTLADVMADWLERPADAHERGVAGRAYAERNHDARMVARRLVDVYEQLPRGRG